MNNYESIMSMFSTLINSTPSFKEFLNIMADEEAEEAEQAKEEEFEKTNTEYFTGE